MAAAKSKTSTIATKKGTRSPPAKKTRSSDGPRRPGKDATGKKKAGIGRSGGAGAGAATRTKPSASKGTASAKTKTAKKQAAGDSVGRRRKSDAEPAKPRAAAGASGTPRATSQEMASRINEIAESSAELRDEIRAMAKTFAGNQKRMSSISGMSESLEAVLLQIQKQSRQISGLKKETKGLFDELEEMGTQHLAIEGLEGQVRSMQQQLAETADGIRAGSASDARMAKKIGDGLGAIKDNSESIARLADAVDAARGEIRKVAARAASAAGTGAEIDTLRAEIAMISDVTQPGSMIGVLRGELERMAGRLDELAKWQRESEERRGDGPAEFDPSIILDLIASGSAKIEQMGSALDSLREQMGQIASKSAAAESARVESSRLIDKRLEGIGDEMRLVVQEEMAGKESAAAASAENAGNAMRRELESIRDGIASMKSETASSMQAMGQQVAATSEKIRSLESDTSRIIQQAYAEMQNAIKSAHEHRQAASDDTDKMIRLSEYQSMIRMNSESKYGDLGTISHMAQGTAKIAALFERGPGAAFGDAGAGAGTADDGEDVKEQSAKSAGGHGSDAGQDAAAAATGGGGAQLPLDVKRWAVGRMFECADKWEIRFSDAYDTIKGAIGSGMLAESLRMQQIRDIYGIRAVNRIKEDLGA